MCKRDRACGVPSATATRAGDCDDALAAVNPAAAEVCNGRDDDCDSLVDDADPGRLGGAVFYTDADGDSYGVTTATTTACSRPTGTAALAGDCDDPRATASTGASELSNPLDAAFTRVEDTGVEVHRRACRAPAGPGHPDHNPSRAAGDGFKHPD